MIILSRYVLLAIVTVNSVGRPPILGAQIVESPPSKWERPTPGQYAVGLLVADRERHVGLWRHVGVSGLVGIASHFWTDDRVFRLEGAWLSPRAWILHPRVGGAFATYEGTQSGRIDVVLDAGVEIYFGRGLGLAITAGTRWPLARSRGASEERVFHFYSTVAARGYLF